MQSLLVAVLAGVSDPETKRKIIGRVFYRSFDDESHLINDVKWLAQGTIYPDVVVCFCQRSFCYNKISP
jgi:GMP synthase PP-ATPase subunit